MQFSHFASLTALQKGRQKWLIALLMVSVLLGALGSFHPGSTTLPSGSPGTLSRTKMPVGQGTRTAPMPTAVTKQAPMQTTMPTATPRPAPGANASPTNAPVVVSDTFARPDQVFWGTASDGQHSWKRDAATAAAFSISNGQGVVQNGNDNSYYDAIIGPVEKDAMVQVSGLMNNYEPMDGDITSISAVLRWQDSRNWYKALINGSQLIIRKQVDGQGTDLASVDFTAQPRVSYTIRFRAVGSTLEASAWQTGTPAPPANTWMLSADDASFTSGEAGIRLSVQGDTMVSINSFTEYNLSGK